MISGNMDISNTFQILHSLSIQDIYIYIYMNVCVCVCVFIDTDTHLYIHINILHIFKVANFSFLPLK